LSNPFLPKGVKDSPVIFMRSAAAKGNAEDFMEGLQQLVGFLLIGRCRHINLFAALLLATAMVRCVASVQAQEIKAEQVRSEIPYRDGIVVIVSDFQERITRTRYSARGRVQITFQDMVVSGDEAQYDEETQEGFMEGQARFSQQDAWLNCSRAEFNFMTKTGTFYDASGYTDRQFYITGRTIHKTGTDKYRVEKGIVTACPGKRPKWSIAASRANIRVDHTARLHTTVFKIKGFPVFYAPYLVMPMEKKERSSGFVPFHTGNSTSKGRMFRQGYYQVLGRSADLYVFGEYFSERGLALGGTFKIRPNPTTSLMLQVYGINDKLNQGGIQLVVDGESQLKDDWRAVAKVNITSNFRFRQAFSDSFHSATIPQERATAFLTRDHNSISTSIAFERQEVSFPTRSVVIRKTPSLEFDSLGTPLGRSPLILSFHTSLDGLSRTDSLSETPRLTQRLDIYPRLTLRLPSLAGFSLVPSVGIRETYYGSQLSNNSPSGISNQGFHRHYADFNIELRTPILERDFSSSWLGNFQHSVEPFVTYRRIHGIKDLDKTIRFDEQDAIADTNEVEYGIVNRFFKNRKTGAGTQEKFELMSFSVIQKYYFDPSFDGAFQPGKSNAFYPLDSVTGFYQTGIPSNLAPVSMIFQISPQSGIHNDIRADFDARRQRWRNGSVSTLWDQGKFRLSGTYFRILALEAGMPASNHIQGQIGYGRPERGLSSSLTVSYNLRTGQLLNSNTRVSYVWDCCGLGVEYNQFDLGLRTESRISFSFTLKGIGSFGSMKRPESLF
jgi:LPS-assembly protein